MSITKEQAATWFETMHPPVQIQHRNGGLEFPWLTEAM